MKAEDFLGQAESIDNLIREKNRYLETLESLATSAPQAINPSGSHGSPDPTKGSKLENQVIDIVDLKEQIQKQNRRLFQIKADIAAVLSKIDNLTIQHVMTARYMNLRSWKAIQSETGFSTGYLYRLHNKGLEQVERIINNRQ